MIASTTAFMNASAGSAHRSGTLPPAGGTSGEAFPGVKRAFDAALHAVAEEFGIAAHVILGRGRTADVSEARHAVLYVARAVEPRASTMRLGQMMGRDHTTVIHSLRAVGDILAIDADFRRRCEAAIATARAEFRALKPQPAGTVTGIPVTAPAPRR